MSNSTSIITHVLELKKDNAIKRFVECYMDIISDCIPSDSDAFATNQLDEFQEQLELFQSNLEQAREEGLKPLLDAGYMLMLFGEEDIKFITDYSEATNNGTDPMHEFELRVVNGSGDLVEKISQHDLNF